MNRIQIYQYINEWYKSWAKETIWNIYKYYLSKADNLYLKVSEEVDETMARGRQFQSPIVFVKNENLKQKNIAGWSA